MLWYFTVLFLTWMLCASNTSPNATYYGYGIAMFGFFGVMKESLAKFEKDKSECNLHATQLTEERLRGRIEELRRRLEETENEFDQVNTQLHGFPGVQGG